MKILPMTVLLMGLAAGGCASRSLDRTFTPEEYLQAARTFEADSALHVQERALYLAGLAYGLPDSPAYSPERAVQLFDRLISLYPDGPRAAHATHLRQLHRELLRNGDSRTRLERQMAEREAALTAAREEIAELEEALTAERARADGLQTNVDRLSGELQRANALVRSIEAELEGLKGIDLNRPRS